MTVSQAPSPGRYPFKLYGAAICLGAFLLLLVQPLIAKHILPWFGGSPEVWTTCMMFFQAALLAGYAYAHLLTSRLGPRAQAAAHLGLLALAAAALPITPSEALRPSGNENPTLGILLLLGATVGLPYVALSATGPLLQHWFARTSGGAAPWRYYALSNAASLAALVSYPVLVEPALSRRAQGLAWSAGMAAFAVLAAACAVRLWRRAGTAAQVEAPQASHAAPLGTRLLWLAFPAVACLELLAVTEKITQDVAAVPLLWVLPLCLYLLSFILCFHSERCYPRRAILAVFVLSLMAAGWAKYSASSLSAVHEMAIYSAALLATCWVCHGELYRLRPEPARLTGYYLAIALGGAIGGSAVAVVAPRVFNSYIELYLGLLACCALVLLADRSKAMRPARRWVYVAMLAAVAVVAVALPDRRDETGRHVVLRSRNFFGVLTVWDVDADLPDRHRYVMQHGTTFHGLQFTSTAKRLEPTAYYGRNSGVGLAVRCLADGPRRIGVIGLGVGTLAAYGRDGDVLRFYEINPQVVRLAEERFSYLSSTSARVETVLGDGRLSMQREEPQEYDLLVLDAFTGGTVPAHLLTREAFDLYLRHLAGGGIIAVHVSSVHLDLPAVVLRLSRELRLAQAFVVDAGSAEAGTFESEWVLLARPGVLDQPIIRAAAITPSEDVWRTSVWTDDRIHLLQVLKTKGTGD